MEEKNWKEFETSWILKENIKMVNTYLSLEYISIVLFGLILVLFSIGSFYLSNVDKDNNEER
jgi:hypothetical protein